MKWRLFGVLMTVVMLLSVAAISYNSPDGREPRVHQHLEARGPDQGCDCDGAELCTHLPIIRIETGGQTIPGMPLLAEIPTASYIRTDEGYVEDPNADKSQTAVVGYTKAEDGSAEILVTIETVEGEGVWHHASDEAVQSTFAYFRIRGNSSRRFPKHNYRLKLVTDETGTEKNPLSLLGMNADDDWVLHGPFLDKTLLRNYMWMNISAEVMGYAPNVRFCEIILDGEYQGVYVLMETIKESDERVSLSDNQEGEPHVSYILRMDAVEREHFLEEEDIVSLNNYTWYTYRMDFTTETKTGFEVLYPQSWALTAESLDYIQRDISAIERGLYSSDMLSGLYDYSAYIDVNSFVDYYILQEFLANNDAFFRSTYLYRDIRGKMVCGPVWDYNNVLNNFFLTVPYDGFFLANRSWYGRLMTDEGFVERVISRYRQLRKGVLSEEYLIDYIDDVVAYLGDAIVRNDEVWGYSYDASLLETNQYRRPDPGHTLEEVNPSSYDDAVERMKDYMLTRGRWLDDHIEDLRQYCHPSRTAAERVE